MFEAWRRAWREAAENFRRELYGDSATGPLSSRLSSMRRDLAAVQRELRRLEQELSQTSGRLDAELQEAEACSRRGALARSIGDIATAELASSYARRHESRASVLRRKAEALQAELDLLALEHQEMESALETWCEALEAGADPDLPGGAPAEDAFRDLESAARDRAAEQRLDELKRREQPRG